MNPTKNSFFILLFFAVLLLSCGRSPRDRSKIPPAPIESDKMRTVAAIEALTDAIRSSPSVPENYFKRANLYIKMQQYQEALDDINRADKLKPNVGKYLFTKALILRTQGKTDEALAAAQSAEILNVDTPELYVLLGDLAQRKKDFKGAEAYLAKSLQMAPYNGESYYYKGLLLAQKGDTSNAINNLLKSTTLKPDYLEPYSELTAIFKGKHLYDSAIVFNSKAIQMHPAEASLFIERGQIYQNVGRLDSALANYSQAAKINPDRVESLIFAGAIYFRWKNYYKAVENYEKALEHSPNLSKVYYLAGICYDKMGNTAKATELLKTAFEKDPEDLQISDAYARLSGQSNTDLVVETPNPVSAPKRTRRSDSSRYVRAEPQKLLDTNRIRVHTIAPKAKITFKADSTKKIKIN